MAGMSATNTSSSGADGVVTLAASTQGKRYVIDWIVAAYDGGSTVTSLTVVSGGSTTVFTAKITVNTTTRTTNINFGPLGIGCGPNEAVVITQGLIASQVATLSVGYHVE